MNDLEKIIDLLNLNDSVSGTDIGAQLGVSRVTVQKRIQQLVDNGLPLEAHPGKGYALDDTATLLSRNSISSAISTDLIESVEVFQSIESTNSYLLQQDVLLGRAKVCLCESQSAGRGRRGNDWQSAPYRNIMMSISWGFDYWPETITGLGLAVSLVVAEQLNRMVLPEGAEKVKIKWPNDLMSGLDKLGGILIDVAGESSGACNVVVGLGLNVHQPDWSNNGDYRWQDLRSLGVDVNRNDLAVLLASSLTEMLNQFSQTGFTPLAERWNALSSYADKTIRVGSGNDFVEGVMLGVDSSGALLLKDEHSNVHRFSDSSVSVRLV